MSLIFGSGGATGERVNVGSDASLDNLSAFTLLAWVYRTGTKADGGLYNKGMFVAQDRHPNWNLRGNDGATPTLSVDRATTDAGATGDNTADVIPLNTWSFQAATFDATAGPKLYRGTLRVPAVEFTYASAPVVGAGALADDSAADAFIGNDAGLAKAFPGRIAVMAVLNRVLSLSEIRAWQFRPRAMAGCVGYWQLGFRGTGTQPDWSGNGNAGIVTSATVGDHVPLGPPWGFDRVVIRVPAGGAVQLVVADLAVAATFDSVALTQAGQLTVAGLTVAATLDAPSLTQANVLAVAGLDVAATLEAVGLTQAHVLAVAALAVAGTLDTIALTQAGQLTVAGLLVAAGLEDVTLQVAGELDPADLAVAATLDAPALTQANQLAVEDLAVAVTLEPVTVTTGTLLEVAALAVATVLDGIALTQANQLAPADLLVAARLAAPALVQAHVLTVGDLLVAVVLDGVVLVLPAGFDRALLTDFTLAAPQLAAVAVAGPQLADVTLRSPRLTSITME